MDFKELHKKYQELLIENNNLKEEIKRLKAATDYVVPDIYNDYVSPVNDRQNEVVAENPHTNSSIINKRSDSTEKVKLFMSLFRGLPDLFVARGRLELPTS